MSELCGYMGGSKLYRIEISIQQFQRLIQLSLEGLHLPNWIEIGASMVAGYRVIATDDPEWFRNNKA